ncbi:trypsin-like peptidase domain-containing protein [Saccharopolyspora sp. K220]|uniref:nSTAND1 domain-containing NTPase n=1 Tax=Saccharopolyspora soli TaxID=2926618 RepID=UPI001F599FDB|nr:trypsin-like peptidase domain-containing protein [Saccharopolyspora soli]MCI2419042.1 trypsin-like peptidase domain-containing protein [Saccharopolyspora soli]
MADRPDLTAAEPLAAALVRLVTDRVLLGTGFVLPGNLIATCAHVVADDVMADFPLLGTSGFAVEVVELDETNDVAILRLLDPPEGVRPAPVRLDTEVLGHRFRVPGFTAAEPEGVWAEGKLTGHQGSGRVQMAVDPHHERIASGFSGAPVWDEQLRGVVGMVVTRSGNTDTTAHLVPMGFFRERVDSEHNPYLGLKPFQEADADRFHGRDDEIAELLGLLEQQDMVAVAGPSGSGKSSLVRAGLLPRLRRTGAVVVELGADDPVEDLAAGGTVLLLDQFEEEVVADPDAARDKLERIIQQIAAHPRRPGEAAPLRVVLTLRSRSLDDLITPDTAKQLNQAVWLLKPMRPEKRREAILRPAESGGLAFEVGLPESILHDSPPGHGTLALLSEVLQQLWQHRQGVWLTHAAYQQLGRVPGALSKRADDVLASLRPGGLSQARRLLTRLTRYDGEGGYARRNAQLADLDPALQEIAHELAAKRLLVIQDEHVNLTHQALIDHWPTLREWLTEDADFLAWHAKLQDLHDSGGLLRDAPLAEAETWLRQRPQDIPEVQRQFIRQSTATQRRDRTRWRTITAVSVTLMLVAAVLAGVVFRNNVELDARIRLINAADLAEASNSATESNPSEALQFALAAWQEEPDSIEALGALLQQRLYWHGVDRVLTEPPLRGVAETLASANGRVVIFVPENPADQVVVWSDLLTANASHRQIPTSQGAQFALTQEGRLLAQYDPDQGLLLWDLTSASDPMVLHPPVESDPNAISFSANSRFLALPAFPDGSPRTILLWDLQDIRSIPEPARYAYDGANPSEALYPSPDGRSVVVIEQSGTMPNSNQGYTAFARDLATGNEIRRSEQAESSDIELLDDGLQVATCADGGLNIRDSFTGAVTYTRTGDCNLLLDASRQFLLFNDNPNGVGISTAVQWRTGAESNFSESVVPRSWDVTPAPLLVPNQDGSLSSVSVRNGAVQVSSIPVGAKRAEVQQVRSDLLAQSPDGKSWVAYGYAPSGLAEDQGEIVLLDSRGVPVRRTNVPAYPQAVAFDASGERVLVVIDARMFIYRTDDLVLERDVALPVPPGRRADEGTSSNAYVRAIPGGPVLVSNLGVVSSWNVRTGVQTRPPLTAASAAGEPLSSGPQIELRPGHPEQVVSQSDSGLSVWDLGTGEQLRTYPVPGSRFVVSTDGAVAAVADDIHGSIAVVDLESDAVPQSLPAQTSQLIGIAGRYLFAEEGTAGVQVWDWRESRKLTTVDLDTNYEAQAVEGNAYLPDRRPGNHERIPLDPETWFYDLCRISDRDFTPQERASLPDGVSDEPPCR